MSQNQKRNKIIVLVGVILLIVFFIWVIQKYPKQKQSSLLSPYQEKIRILNSECSTFNNLFVNVCRYSPLKKAVVSNDFNIGDLIMVQINPQVLFQNQDLYGDITNKLGNKFNLCFNIQPSLEEQQFLSTTNLISFVDGYQCLPALTFQTNKTINFTGYVPSPIKDSKLSIQIWSASDELINSKSKNHFNTKDAQLLFVFSYNINK